MVCLFALPNEEVTAYLQDIIRHIDACVKDRESRWFEEDTNDYHRWRDAAVTNSAKLQRWVNAERSWSMFITRTLCTKLQADPALLVDKFLFGSWHSEESSFTGNDTAGCDASDAGQREELEEEEEEAEEEQQEDEEVEEEEEEIGEHVDEDDDDTADHEIAHAHAGHANALDRGQNEMPQRASV